MQKHIRLFIEALVKAKQQHKRWVNVVTGLMAAVVFVTTYALILPAITMTADKKELVCPLEVHQHQAECYDNTGALICGQADFVIHSHNEDCYDENGELVCSLPEIKEHSHNEDCYMTLIECGKEEAEPHSHDADCYETVLSCGLEEGQDGHVHDDSCYTEELGCGLEETEGHSHDESCYKQYIVCQLPEAELHSHTKDCYESYLDEDGKEQRQLSCGKLMVTEHVHGEGCFKIIEDEEEATEQPAPEVTEEAADLPAATSEDVGIEPENTAEPDVAAEAVVTAEPEVTVEPEVTSEPEVTVESIEGDAEEVGSLLSTFSAKLAAASTTSTLISGTSVYWSVDTTNGILYLTGTGATRDYTSYSGAPWYSNRSSIKTVIVGEGITSIGNYSFAGLTKVTSVTLPSTLTSIGNYAFSTRTTLTSINFPAALETIGIYAFQGCTGLTTVSLPEGLKSIGNYAFQNCTKLSSVEVLGGTIGQYAFYKCTALTNLSLAEGVTYINSYAFYGCTALASVSIPSTVTTIGGSAFSGCTMLAELTIAEGVTSIGSSAFQGCTALASVSIPSTVTTIGGSAFSGCTKLTTAEVLGGAIGDSVFYNCSALTDLTLAEGVTSIGNNTFQNCSKLTSLTIPSTVTTIGPSSVSSSIKSSTVFYGCTSLTDLEILGGAIGPKALYQLTSLKNLTLGENVTSVGSYAFYGCTKLETLTMAEGLKTIDTYAFYNCSALEEVSIPNSVTSIGAYAFGNCSKLAKVTLPEELTSIGASAFRSCTALTEISIPETVTSIGNYAFSGCTGLTEISIPSSVTSIGASAFSGCTGLTEISIPDSVTSIGNYAFSGCTGLTEISIPDSVTSIGNYAFNGCTGLTEISIPDSVTSIGNYAFNGCTALTSASISGTSATLGSYAFSGCTSLKSLTINEGITSIQDRAFKGCSALVEVSLPGTVQTMGSYVFSGCTALTTFTFGEGMTTTGNYTFAYDSSSTTTTACTALKDVSLPSTLVTIGDYAFNGCTKLVNASIPENVETIGIAAFSGCSLLTGVTIPSKVTSIGGSAFANCKALTECVLPESLQTLGGAAFSGCTGITEVSIPDNVTVLAASTFSGCTGLTDVTLPEGLTSIYSYAFYGCTKLASIQIPSTVTSIGSYAFYNCAAMTGIDLPVGLTSIGTYAFYGCTKITKAVIPEGVTSIGEYTFYGCSGLTELSISEGVTSIGQYAFYGCSSLTEVSLPDSVTSIGQYAFYGCSSLVSAKLPSTLTAIPDYMFRNCSKLTEIDIPKTVESIGIQAFYNCTSLEKMVLPEALTTIGSSAFYNCSKVDITDLVLPSGVTSIGATAFSGWTQLESVTFPEGLVTVNGFYGCTSLTEINIPSTVTSIGASAFYDCTALKSVNIPDSVTTINASAFYGCIALEEVELPSGLTTLGKNAFYNCKALKELTIDGNYSSSGLSATTPFYNAQNLDVLRLNTADLTAMGSSTLNGTTVTGKMVIGDGVDTLYYSVLNQMIASTGASRLGFEGPNSFTYNGSTITSLNNGMNLTSGDYYVSALGALYRLGEGNTATLVFCPDDEKLDDYSVLFERFELDGEKYDVVAIDQNAFCGNQYITEITIPDTITSIGEKAFYNCTNLAKLNKETTIKAAVATLNAVYGTNTFKNTALWGADEKDPGLYTISETGNVSISKGQEGGTSSEDNSNTYIFGVTISVSDPIDEEGFTTLTGKNAFITIDLKKTGGGVTDKLRVYFLAEDGCSIYQTAAQNKANGKTAVDTIFGYAVDEQNTFTTQGASVPCTFHTTDTRNLYYMEIDSINAGDTLSLSLSTNYPNLTAGGSLYIWPDNSLGTKVPETVDVAQWVCQNDTYALKRSNYSSASVSRSGDDVYLSSFAVNVELSKKNTVDSSYGQNLVEQVAVEYTQRLNSALYWKDGILDAIKAGNWYTTQTGRGTTQTSTVQSYIYYYVLLNGKYVCLGYATAYDYATGCMQDGTLAVDDDGNIVFGWTRTNPNTNKDIYYGYAMRICIYSQMIYADYSKLSSLVGTSSTYTLTSSYSATADVELRYGGEQELSVSGSTTQSVTGPSYSMSKSSSPSSTNWNGGTFTYKINLSNSSMFSVSGINTISDTLPTYLYLTPAQMEDMFADSTYGKKLTITISNGQVSNTVARSVTNIDGTKEYISNSDYLGSNTTYNGMSSSDPCGEMTMTVVVKWNSSKQAISATFTPKTGTAQTFIVGEDCTSLSAAFSTMNFRVTSSTQYACSWSVYTSLAYQESKSLSFSATTKNTLQYTSSDKESVYNSGSLSFQNFAYVNQTSSYSYSKSDSTYSYINNTEYSIYKSAKRNGSTLSDSTTLQAGDILTYTNKVQAYHYCSGLPIVDKMSGGQALLVPVSENPQLADEGLSVVTDGGISYYILNKAGTYNNVKMGTKEKYASGSTTKTSAVADTVTVTATSTGYTTMIYCYMDIYNTTASLSSNYNSIVYKAIMTVGENIAEGTVNLPVKNEVWLGDHQGHRLYDSVSYYEVFLTIGKKIVTNATDEITTEHDPSTDTVTSSSYIRAGNTVVYRLALTKLGADTDESCLTVYGSSLKDTLPVTYGSYWSKDNIDIVYVPANENSVIEVSDASEDAWSISTGKTTITTTQYLTWSSSFTIKLRGTGYIYVILHYPDADSTIWSRTMAALSGSSLSNQFQVGTATASVSHKLVGDATAMLQKGVYYTGYIREYTNKSGNYTYNYSYFVPTNSENARTYYANDAAYQGAVCYYVALYNAGTSRLYINDIQDVLPEGFTFAGLYNGTNTIRVSTTANRLAAVSNSGYSNNYYTSSSSGYTGLRLMSADLKSNYTTSTVVPSGYTTRYAAVGTFTPSVTTTSDGRERVTFKLTSYDSSASSQFGYDSALGKYYLKPGQMTCIMYYAYTGDGSDSEDISNNVVSMPYYSYQNSDLILTDKYTFTPANYTSQTANNGTIQLLTSAEAAALGMNTNGITSNKWLTSSVNVSRGDISPGIIKSTSQTEANTKDTLTWTVKFTAGEEANLHDYTITEVMMSPYSFTSMTLKIGYSDGLFGTSYTPDKSYTVTLPTETDKETVYNKGTTTEYRTLLSKDDSGNYVLTVRFVGSAYDLPYGHTGTLTINTLNTTNTNENKDYVNKCYLTPNTQNFERYNVTSGNYTVYDVELDDLDVALPTISSEARIPVSYGYATTAYVSVSQVSDADNIASSYSNDNQIVVSGSSTDLFTYTLTVNNSGGTTAPATAMTLFVMVDNLPEVNDHLTFYDEYARYSDFLVNFADDPAVKVYITTSDGTTTYLTDDQYGLLFSQQSSFEYSDNQDIWNGKALTEDDGWYTLEECLSSGTLGSMRSIRVVIRDEDAAAGLMPQKASINVSFNAKVNEDAETSYSDVAWNSFGYLYEVSGNTLQSASAVVGVKTPGIPYLTKKLVGFSGETYTAKQDETFRFLIYEGANQDLSSTLSADELLSALAELDIPGTIVTLDVAAGASSSETLGLAELYVYEKQTDGTWAAGSEPWTWDNNATYTIQELPMDENSDFTYSSMNGSQKNSLAFGYTIASATSVTVTNKKISGAIKITKLADRDDSLLSGAVFGLYTPNESDAMSATAKSKIDAALLAKAESQITVGETTWYLKELATTNDQGTIQWTGLMEEKYYVLEVEAPGGYSMGSEPGQEVEIEFNDTVEVEIYNYWQYSLPHTGSIGTEPVMFTGAVLVIASTAIWLFRRKKQHE